MATTTCATSVEIRHCDVFPLVMRLGNGWPHAIWIGSDKTSNERVGMMERETVRSAQQCVDERSPEEWRDITVPQVRTGIPPRPRNVTVEEWGEMLRKQGMVGVYRAYTSHTGRVALIVTKESFIKLELREDTDA